MTAGGEFYQAHLDRVSRSFAFCIRQLPEPLHEWVGLSYLLCRVVDTIEDSPWRSSAEQMRAFAKFDQALRARSLAQGLTDWMQEFPAGIAAGEQALLRDAAVLLNDFHAFPAQVHEIIREIILSMSRGMQHFSLQRKNGSLRLGTLAEVNQYCFFVAGVVGELLVKLINKVEPSLLLSEANLLRAHHFGLFLQKVNLLKDQVGDERHGRHLIPSREVVEDSSERNADEALAFLLDLPKEQPEFRRFCAWSLFLGLEALSVARQSIFQNKVLKVPRAEMEALLVAVENALSDDGALRGLFQGFAAKLGWPKVGLGVRKSVEFPQWLLQLYRGPLDSRSLAELGV